MNLQFLQFYILRCSDTGVYFTKLIRLKIQKASEKALTLLKDNLELPLRPIQAIQMTIGPFWTRQTRLEAFWTSNRNLATCRGEYSYEIYKIIS